MRTLRRGDKGPEVAAIQNRLNELGVPDYNGLVLVVDGDYGPRTQSAVKAAQERWYDDLGVCGPLTFLMLEHADQFPQPEQPPATGSLAERVVAVARAYHKNEVVERPYGSNKGGAAPGVETKYSVNAIQQPWFPGAGYAWCAMFVATVIKEAGYDLPPSSKYWWPLVSEWVRYGRSLGRLYNGATYKPAPGDLFTIGSSSHIGIVESVNGTQVTTIEGNTRNRVGSNLIAASKPAYYIRLG